MADPQAGTTIVDRQYLETLTIHGREYQKYSIENSTHFVPVDEEEAERLESQHRVFDLVFDQRLLFPPVTTIKNILDCGYGSASWAVEVADSYPDCTVVGVDISPHMKPDNTPENFWPQLDDINRSFTFDSNSFDLVHSRLVAGGINRARWPAYLRDIKRILKPGGWVQMVELYYQCQSDNGSLTDAHALRQWSTNYIRSIEGVKDPRAPTRLRDLLVAAGFVDIEFRMIQLPLCGWSADQRQRRIGNAYKAIVEQALSTLAIYPLTRRLNMTIDAVNGLVTRARADAANPSLKAYFPLYVCIAKKAG